MSLLKNLKENDLKTADLKRFELIFARAVRDFLPCRDVHFLSMEPSEGQTASPMEPAALPSSWETGAAMVSRTRLPVADRDRLRLYLPIWNREDFLGIAIVEAEDGALFEMSNNWLLDRSHLLSREFLKHKQWAIDPISGLLTGRYFLEEIRELLLEKKNFQEQGPTGADHETDCPKDASFSPCLSVAFLEIYPLGATKSSQAVQHIAQAAFCLESLIGGHAPVHHFGSGLFAMIWNGISVEQSLKMGKTLLKKLRQENYRHARLGLNTVSLRTLADQDWTVDRQVRQLVEQAMNALEEAGRRGPSALFNWASQKDSPLFEMEMPEAETVRAFQKLWKGVTRFSIVFLQEGRGERPKLFGRKFLSLLGHPAFAVGKEGVFVFLPAMGTNEASVWLSSLREKLSGGNKQKGLRASDFQAGIAGYPCLNFSKQQILVNARKALLHARLLGAASCAVFDDVTLNISGDVYYNEGDLATAIREYEKGLKLNPSSINLLNSLAVCEAQMDRQPQAIRLFEKALDLDQHDFMALYNLGFSCLQSGKREKAIAYFERAYQLEKTNDDLVLQLARLYCETKQFERAVSLLQPIVEDPRQKGDKPSSSALMVDSRLEQSGEKGRQAIACRYLAEAYVGLNQLKKAVVLLQRANRYQPNDPATLSLLGYCYSKAGQGDDIALSLCRKAVENDGGQWRYWYNLATVLFNCRQFREAERALKTCLRLQPREESILQLLAVMNERMGRTKQAEKLRQRVVQNR
jgi:Flp pilus assembly protein TadD/GGDEF domain-containing protein